jgi:hypothetical protein
MARNVRLFLHVLHAARQGAFSANVEVARLVTLAQARTARV